MVGADGKIHAGNIDRWIGWRMLQTDCGAEALRPLGPNEAWWVDDPDRPCWACLADVTPNEQGALT
jgi:hypothetical protein